MSGTTVETTIRVLGRWIKQGIVCEREGRFVIPSPEALDVFVERDR